LLITLRDLDLVQVQHYVFLAKDLLATSSPKLRHIAQEDKHLWMPSLWCLTNRRMQLQIPEAAQPIPDWA
jgi:hypothetical protein